MKIVALSFFALVSLSLAACTASSEPEPEPQGSQGDTPAPVYVSVTPERAPVCPGGGVCLEGPDGTPIVTPNTCICFKPLTPPR